MYKHEAIEKVRTYYESGGAPSLNRRYYDKENEGRCPIGVLLSDPKSFQSLVDSYKLEAIDDILQADIPELEPYLAELALDDCAEQAQFLSELQQLHDDLIGLSTFLLSFLMGLRTFEKIWAPPIDELKPVKEWLPDFYRNTNDSEIRKILKDYWEIKTQSVRDAKSLINSRLDAHISWIRLFKQD